MKAVQINGYGGPEVLQIFEDVKVPTPKDAQVVVEVYAVTFNPFDIKLIEGKMKDKIPLIFPYQIGGDFSGIIKATNEEVYGQASFLSGNSGSFAEFLTVSTDNYAPKPIKSSFEEAAALPLVGVSAVQAIEDHLNLQKGQAILIHGGAGGIGHIAIQLAKAKGARVITTVSTHDVDFAKKIGVDEVIDYQKDDFTKLKNLDAVFDTVGGEVKEKSLNVLKRGGKIVSMIGRTDPELTEKLGIISIGQGTKVTRERLIRLSQYIDTEIIQINLDKVYQLSEIKDAFERQKSHPQGKIAIKFKD